MARAMACPGSVNLSVGCVDPESEYAELGTAAHTLAEYCLVGDLEPWKFIGSYVKLPDGLIAVEAIFPEDSEPQEFGYWPVDKEMADAVTEYVADLNAWHPKSERNQGNWYVEREFYCPTIHKYMWGKSDASFINFDERILDVWDYKHGAGVMVFPENNVQGMYYGCGILEDMNLWEGIDSVRIHIHQPRGYLDAHRYWEISTYELEDWMMDKLIPAMDRALASSKTASGEHCQFCPVRFYACPEIVKEMKRFARMVSNIETGKKKVKDYTPEQLGELYRLRQIAKGPVGKAIEQVCFDRRQAGIEVPGTKLVPARSNRVWRNEKEVEQILKDQFGAKKAYEKKLLSPAAAEKLPGGADIVSEHAFKPPKGLSLVSSDDPRLPVSRDKKALFTPVEGKK